MQTESSVIANLAEIMQLEHERVAAERRAEQAAREALERARLLQAQRERREAERALHVQARLQLRAERRKQREARERELALLRVRLDVEERARLQRVAQARSEARALEAPRHPRGARARWLQRTSWLAAVASIVGAAVWHVHRGAAELEAVRVRERAARQTTLAAIEQAAGIKAELDALRAASAAVPGAGQGAARAADAPPVAARTATTAQTGGKSQPSRTRTAATSSTAPRERPVPLGELEEPNDDPLGDLFDHGPRRRSR
jgi:hypothetical protein